MLQSVVRSLNADAAARVVRGLDSDAVSEVVSGLTEEEINYVREMNPSLVEKIAEALN